MNQQISTSIAYNASVCTAFLGGKVDKDLYVKENDDDDDDDDDDDSRERRKSNDSNYVSP